MRLSRTSSRILKKRRVERGLYRFFHVSPENPNYLTLVRRRLGIHESLTFRKELESYLARIQGNVVLDLKHLDYLDQAGLVAILQTRLVGKTRRGNGYDLTLSNVHGKPLKELEDYSLVWGYVSQSNGK